MKMGAVKLRAVIFASGVIDNAVKNISMAAMLITPLNACSPIWFVRRIVNRERNKSGKKKAKPKMLRKKAIWKLINELIIVAVKNEIWESRLLQDSCNIDKPIHK